MIHLVGISVCLAFTEPALRQMIVVISQLSFELQPNKVIENRWIFIKPHSEQRQHVAGPEATVNYYILGHKKVASELRKLPITVFTILYIRNNYLNARI